MAQAGRQQAACRTGETEHQHQRDQVARPGIVGDKELGAAAQDVEGGLYDCQAPKAGEVKRFDQSPLLAEYGHPP